VGVRLRPAPRPPPARVWIVGAVDRVDPTWQQYLRLPEGLAAQLA
jgi:hypothetical protein